MVKIKISYEAPGDLERVMALLAPLIKSAKIKHEQTGIYKRAYINLK